MASRDTMKTDLVGRSAPVPTSPHRPERTGRGEGEPLIGSCGSPPVDRAQPICSVHSGTSRGRHVYERHNAPPCRPRQQAWMESRAAPVLDRRTRLAASRLSERPLGSENASGSRPVRSFHSSSPSPPRSCPATQAPSQTIPAVKSCLPISRRSSMRRSSRTRSRTST